MPEPAEHYRARRAHALVDRAAGRVRRRARPGYESRLYLQALELLRRLTTIYYLGLATEREQRRG